VAVAFGFETTIEAVAVRSLEEEPAHSPALLAILNEYANRQGLTVAGERNLKALVSVVAEYAGERNAQKRGGLSER
jgi:hypothetical protein